MKPLRAPRPPEGNDELSALILALHRTEQRIEELTGGEVDTVADREGRSFLLRRAQEFVRHNQDEKQAAILNALPAHIALLDAEGIIVSVNAAWRQFAVANALQGLEFAIGVNYLAVCDAAQGADAAVAHQAASEVRAVLGGKKTIASLEYPCDSPSEERWFLLTVTPLAAGHPNGAVVMHLDITARKHSERELGRLVAATDAIDDAILLIDRAAMRIIHVNDAACRYEGLTRQELLARDPWTLIALPRSKLEFVYDSLIASGSSAAPLEIQRPRADGTDAWVELRRHALLADGRWIIFSMIRDITERKRVEQELQASEERFSGAFVQAPIGVALVSPEGRWLQVNRVLCDLVGYSEAELLCKTFQDITHPDDLEADLENVCCLIAGKIVSYEMEKRYIHARGNLVSVLINVSLARNYIGKPLYFISHIRDITETKQAAQKLSESDRRFSDMLDNVQLLSLMLDCEARILYCNDYLLRLTGWRREEVIGRDWFELFIAPDLHHLRDSILPAIFANLPDAMHDENEILTRVGERRLILWSNTVLRSDTGEVVGLASIGEDITERKEAEVRIAQLNRVYAVLSGINALIVRARSGDELFAEACRIAVDQGGFHMAMIGMVEPGSGIIRAVATAGKEENLLAAIRGLLTSSDLASSTMVSRAIREKCVIVSNDSQHDPQLLLKAHYAEAKVCSLAVLPLIVEGHAVGALALYAGEVEFFHADEIKLLTELTGDISFAIDHLAKRDRIDYLAYYDELTGLANAKLFLERIGQYIVTTGEGKTQFAVVMVDVDRFKTINDSLGRQAGDDLLKQIAERLRCAIADSNWLARIGSDRFTMVIPDIVGAESAGRDVLLV